MADVESQGGGAEPGCCGKCLRAIKNLSPETLSRIMRVINAINSVLLCFVGIWTFLAGGNIPLLTILASLYVIMFSLVLFFFEIRFEFCNVCFLQNMGFMFSWRGRLFFFIFVGTLAVGLGTPGIIIGIFTFVNAMWNVTVVCIHPAYFQKLKDDAEEEVRKAILSEAGKYGAGVAAGAIAQAAAGGGGGGGSNTLDDVADAAGFGGDQKAQAASGPSLGGGGGSGLPANWEQRTDQASGDTYYVNKVTGETSWERPTATA